MIGPIVAVAATMPIASATAAFACLALLDADIGRTEHSRFRGLDCRQRDFRVGGRLRPLGARRTWLAWGLALSLRAWRTRFTGRTRLARLPLGLPLAGGVPPSRWPAVA